MRRVDGHEKKPAKMVMTGIHKPESVRYGTWPGVETTPMGATITYLNRDEAREVNLLMRSAGGPRRYMKMPSIQRLLLEREVFPNGRPSHGRRREDVARRVKQAIETADTLNGC